MKLQQIDEFRWRIPREGSMRVPGLVFASEQMVAELRRDSSTTQVANVAHLPGIVGHAIAMPDIHAGYGFPIGGVAAFDEQDGVISPGGVGYDINCGVRLLRSDLPASEVSGRLDQLSSTLHRAVPSGVGSKSHRGLTEAELDEVLREGARAVVQSGFGWSDDLETIEEGGCLRGAEPAQVSDRARRRGLPQLGSLGSGNHFCEIGRVAEVYDDETALTFGLERDRITLMIHSGSRGLGHQVCDDSLRDMLAASRKYGIALPDRQLCAAPVRSPEAERYFAAMACAVNFAFANRQMLTHFCRDALARFFGRSAESLGLRLVYDVCHNIAKWETHQVRGKPRRVCVHRKGATRAFGPGHDEVPARYRTAGQPVLVPGDMGRYSYVLVGTSQAMTEAWGSSCHGAGRKMSRAQAKRMAKGRPIVRQLRDRGIWVRSNAKHTLMEEIPDAYKDVADVVDVIDGAGLARKVARLEPLAVIKG
ncbi:MAG: RtcB family protein [Deltaproteobacteria bacterium]|jgi:tRNA-splicing ligase RtcB|nr:RtcB family protein [Deltaproteobacteria bacterium]MBW2536803.1 RtcB family protein [Deltaproteobacteria bacterium]